MKILCFGDSNTWGHNPVDCSQLSRPWPVVLQEMMKADEILSDGVCGRATVDLPLEPNTDGLKAFREKYVNANFYADWIIIMLGTNDALIKFKNRDIKTAVENIRTYMREYREQHGDTKFLIVSPIYANEVCLTHPIFRDLYDRKSIEKTKSFAPLFERMAKEEGAYFMDAAKYAYASDIDGIHMTEEEHKKLAQAVYDFLGGQVL